jgi:hypothetical protein
MSQPGTRDPENTKAHDSLEMWQAAGIMPTCFTKLRVLDMACGCAIRSLALAQKSTGIFVTCLDRPEVLPAAGDLAQRMNVALQVTLCPGDLLIADLGAARYDACLLGAVTCYLAEQQNRDIFRRIKTALIAGGLLVLDVPTLAGTPGESVSSSPLAPWNSEDAGRSVAVYDGWLKDAGFREVKQVGKTWLVANK